MQDFQRGRVRRKKMKDNVRKELDTLKMMISNWAKADLKYIEETNNEWLIEEFSHKITTYLDPYIARLRATEYITFQEVREFDTEVSEIVKQFIEVVLAGKKPVEKKEDVDIARLSSQFEIHKYLIDTRQHDRDFIVEQKIKAAEIALKLIPALLENQHTCEKEKGMEECNKECLLIKLEEKRKKE